MLFVQTTKVVKVCLIQMDKSVMINVSKKLDNVPNSSTEMEVVSIKEGMPKCTWFQYFCKTQGEKLCKDIMMQNNKISI